MAATYELIELTFGNVAGDYSTEEEALERLRQAYETHGASAVADLSLMRIENGEQLLVAMQDDLINLALSLRQCAVRGWSRRSAFDNSQTCGLSRWRGLSPRATLRLVDSGA